LWATLCAVCLQQRYSFNHTLSFACRKTRAARSRKEGGTLGMVRKKSRENEWVTRQEAYSKEMINAGWSTGGGDVKDAAFYCYAAPTPREFAEQKVRPAAAFYHQTTGRVSANESRWRI
jgi:hypothetical protein